MSSPQYMCLCVRVSKKQSSSGQRSKSLSRRSCDPRKHFHIDGKEEEFTRSEGETVVKKTRGKVTDYTYTWVIQSHLRLVFSIVSL